MSFQVIVTEKEILDTPNYFELGKLINNKYWQAKRDSEGPQIDDEHFGLTIDENGLVTSINRPDDHEDCVLCGKKTPYLKSTNINFRRGYVEGAGQLCSDCSEK
jgi:hypothetical protein